MSTNIPSAGWIRAVREALGWSSYELARRAGVSQPTVMNWEKREREGKLTLASLRRAAEAMECDFYYVFDSRGEPVASPAKTAAKPSSLVKSARKPKAKPPFMPTRTAAIVSSKPSSAVDPNDIWGG